jgi:histidinol phosphatase-like enzyme
MAFDAHANFAYSTVATAPSPANSGTSLTVATGDGAKFPAVPFNATVWPASTQPTTANAEIVRVTNISGDVLTITRTQESTSARTVLVGDQIADTITAKTFTDIESAITANLLLNIVFRQYFK